ncbi:MAG: hypothetical protein ACRC0F_04825 [Cetobacterium sp.]
MKKTASSEVIEFREMMKIKANKLPQDRKFEFLARITPVKSFEEIYRLCKEFQIEI